MNKVLQMMPELLIIRSLMEETAMSKPLNMSEIDWLKSEIKRLQEQSNVNVGHGAELNELQARLQEQLNANASYNAELNELRERYRQLENENEQLKRRLEDAGQA